MTYTSRISSRYVYCAARLERVLFIALGVCVFFCGLHIARSRLVRKGRSRDLEAKTTFSKRHASFSLALPTATLAGLIIRRTTRRRSSLRPLRRRRSEKMADNWTQSVVCRYFKNGACREGNNCRYRHAQVNRNDANINETVTSPTNNPGYNVTCRFFKQGICKFGNQCRFIHSTSSTDNDVAQINAIENSVSGQHTANSLKNKKGDKRNAEDWVKAPEFVPTAVSPVAGSSSTDVTSASGTSMSTSKPVSYAQAVNPSGQASSPSLEPLCPYAEATGICRNLNCTYLHGDICELCSRAVLHPHNEELRKKHTNACVKQHEADMELSFAIQRSKEKSCGVCFETIMEKSSREQRFGILPNCNHCFCLTCIRKWRQAKQFDNKIIRACPECRIPSDFVCPSMYWVDTKEEKEKLIRDYKGALSIKDCKYFNKGRGKCPFGNKCFYLHALPDGTKKDVGPPVRQRRNTADADIDILHEYVHPIIAACLLRVFDRVLLLSHPLPSFKPAGRRFIIINKPKVAMYLRTTSMIQSHPIDLFYFILASETDDSWRYIEHYNDHSIN